MEGGSANLSLDEFVASLSGEAPPVGLDNALEALWYEARDNGPGATKPLDGEGDMSDDWKTAHRLVQRQRDARGRWVHGYLHRLEGDADNAAGWYERAGQPYPTVSAADEWTQIARALLAR